MIKNKFLAVGVMSGTSMDGIDISLIFSDGKKSYKHIKSKFYSYKQSTKSILFKLVDSFNVSKHSLALISSAEELVTFEYIVALKNFLKDENLFNIDLIALHGQTIFHDPINKSSIQLCDELKIKNSFKLPIVSDFRQKDLSLGGQGAPLTPIFHKLLMLESKMTPPVCFVNIGGISNITVIDDQ
ncbi:anhydro-N-acetylmuramic acid kinase, partial [Pelagibacteraceae bacterium]|nr:anhydro-N-acetylmuramic acid kinase [Pelagibacteraceae bacterium]